MLVYVAVICLGVQCFTADAVDNREACEINRQRLVDVHASAVLFHVRWGKHVFSGCREVIAQ